MDSGRRAFGKWMRTADFSIFENQRELIWKLGHLPRDKYPDTSRDTRYRVSELRPRDADFIWGVASFQEYSSLRKFDGLLPLKVDGAFGSVTAKSPAERFCTCEDIPFGAAGMRRWAFRDLNVYSRIKDGQIGGWSATESARKWIHALRLWSDHIDVTFNWWKESDGNNGPNGYVDAQNIDGRGNVVMYQYLPNSDEPRTTKLQMVIDTSENYLQNNWFFTNGVAHEGGHLLGEGHIPNKGSNLALMNPYLQKLPTLGPQPLDVAALRRRYPGNPSPDPGPGPGPQPPPDDGVEVLGSEHLGTAKDGRVLIATYTLETRD